MEYQTILPGGAALISSILRVLFQLFNAFNARSEEASAFEALFSNRWLWAAVTLLLLLHGAVLYIPFLQEAFSTTGLEGRRLAVLRGGG